MTQRAQPEIALDRHELMTLRVVGPRSAAEQAVARLRVVAALAPQTVGAHSYVRLLVRADQKVRQEERQVAPGRFRLSDVRSQLMLHGARRVDVANGEDEALWQSAANASFAMCTLTSAKPKIVRKLLATWGRPVHSVRLGGGWRMLVPAEPAEPARWAASAAIDPAAVVLAQSGARLGLLVGSTKVWWHDGIRLLGLPRDVVQAAKVAGRLKYDHDALKDLIEVLDLAEDKHTSLADLIVSDEPADRVLAELLGLVGVADIPAVRHVLAGGDARLLPGLGELPRSVVDRVLGR